MRSYGQFCALARALDHVGHRWTLLIVRELLLGPKRFTDLRAGLPGIANNLLADRLRELQDDGLVERRELSPPAASTVYELTAAGQELRESIDALIRWGGRWMPSGIGDDVFRADWLVLALQALGAGSARTTEATVELVVDGGVVRLTGGGPAGTVRLSGGGPGGSGDRAGDREPDVRVTTDAATILGLAAGALTREEALERVHLDPDDPEAVEAFVSVVAT